MAAKKKAGSTSKRKVRVRKTPRNIGDEIIAGLEEAVAFERGEQTGATFSHAPISTRHAFAAPAPDFSPNEIAAIRKVLGYSQALFAQALNVSRETARSWEQGKAPPSGPSKRLLEIAKKRPEIFRIDVMQPAQRAAGREVVRRAAGLGERRSGADRRSRV